MSVPRRRCSPPQRFTFDVATPARRKRKSARNPPVTITIPPLSRPVEVEEKSPPTFVDILEASPSTSTTSSYLLSFSQQLRRWWGGRNNNIPTPHPCKQVEEQKENPRKTSIARLSPSSSSSASSYFSRAAIHPFLHSHHPSSCTASPLPTSSSHFSDVKQTLVTAVLSPSSSSSPVDLPSPPSVSSYLTARSASPSASSSSFSSWSSQLSSSPDSPQPLPMSSGEISALPQSEARPSPSSSSSPLRPSLPRLVIPGSGGSDDGGSIVILRPLPPPLSTATPLRSPVDFSSSMSVDLLYARCIADADRWFGRSEIQSPLELAIEKSTVSTSHHYRPHHYHYSYRSYHPYSCCSSEDSSVPFPSVGPVMGGF